MASSQRKFIWSFSDFVSYYTLTCTSLFASFFAAVTGPLRGKGTPSTWSEHVYHSKVRASLNSIATTRWTLGDIRPSTEEQYCMLARQKDFKPLIWREADITHGFWIGNPDTAKKVLIWYHGGGYTSPALDGHMRLLWTVFQDITPKEANFAVFIQSYTLSGIAPYPTQLRQSVTSLQYLLNKTKLSPSSIALGGDSAGGHLLLSVLSHLLHAHPDIDIPRLTLKPSFAGCLLVSPWTSHNFHTDSFKRNQYSDMLTQPAMDRVTADLKGGAKPDEYNEADLADPSWWKGLEDVSGPIAVIAGEDEVLLDGIGSTVNKMQEGTSKEKIEYSIFAHEGHAMPVNSWDLGEGWFKDCKSAQFSREWVKDSILGQVS